ncbi:MAG TPA: pirin family protein [Acidimicrobiia bacterium]|jgi:redox-sensitive bicupin YhaK (pirin superfamily)|nr:pirin family protein [Acidimicrobiia bacterium]
MSGPIDELGRQTANLGISSIEVREGRIANIGRLGIVRVLPTKNRRTIGPWCFVDLMQAGDLENPPPLEIGPHPHIGLATVTWLFTGTALHSDSLGTEQLIRPGQLNLMTAGNGIAHAEEGVATGETSEGSRTMGVQMWLAQPERTRHGTSAFQHLEELPVTEVSGARARVLIGRLEEAESPALFGHPSIGLDLELRGPSVIPTDPGFEHGVVPIDRTVRVDEEIVPPGSLAIVPTGRQEIRLDSTGYPARVMLLGGEPLGETVKMWWNFVARTTDELTEAWHDWNVGNEDRFGPVPTQLARIEAPTPPWIKPD